MYILGRGSKKTLLTSKFYEATLKKWFSEILSVSNFCLFSYVVFPFLQSSENYNLALIEMFPLYFMLMYLAILNRDNKEKSKGL